MLGGMEKHKIAMRDFPISNLIDDDDGNQQQLKKIDMWNVNSNSKMIKKSSATSGASNGITP